MFKPKSLSQLTSLIRFLVAVWQFADSRSEYKLKRDQVTKLAIWQVALALENVVLPESLRE